MNCIGYDIICSLLRRLKKIEEKELKCLCYENFISINNKLDIHYSYEILLKIENIQNIFGLNLHFLLERYTLYINNFIKENHYLLWHISIIFSL